MSLQRSSFVLHRHRIGATLVAGSASLLPSTQPLPLDGRPNALRADVADSIGLQGRPRPPLESPTTPYRIGASPEARRKSSMASHTSLRNGGSDSIVGTSASIGRLRQWIARVASTHVPVLISGETGTGKELVASAIHERSARSSKRLLCLNCAALPDSLLESELFGYDRGAFTGAHEARAGLLRSCDGGTLFLDEVGDLSLPAQAKLLRVLEAKQVSRLGDGRTWPVDFRLVAATNRDLDAMVQQGLFRKDLFYRLRVACVHVPPLRDRIEDVPALIDQWVAVFNREFGVDIEGVAAEVMSCFMAHTWPGNVRELRNVLETAFITCTDGVIRLSDLPAYLQPRSSPVADTPVGERERLLSTLASVHWNKSRAASLLNWSRMTLYRKLAKYGLAEADTPPRDTPPQV